MIELNRKYYDLFSDLHCCREVLPQKQRARMEDAIMASYKRELDKLVGEELLQSLPEAYTLKLKLKGFVPRGILFRNKVARELRRRNKLELMRHLKELRKETEKSLEQEEKEKPAEEKPAFEVK